MIFPGRCVAVLSAAALMSACSAPPAVPIDGSPPSAAEALNSSPNEAQDWLRIILAGVPPLRNERGNRWPLVLWDQPDPERLSAADIAQLLARGIAPHLRVDRSRINAALRIQAAGAPVILLEGRAGSWPYNLAGSPEQWAYRFAEGAEVPPAWRRAPVPTRTEGWHIAARELRGVLTGFRDAGVVVDAVWLDYEGEPSTASYAAALASVQARDELPAGALADEDAWFRFTRGLWMSLLSTYIAAPVRDVFPRASVTNWVATLSSRRCPVISWSGRAHPPQGATLFTHSNPVAYAIDRAYAARGPREPATSQARVDAFYTHVMLRQVSADACNRRREAPDRGAVAWVARWVPDLQDSSIPVMSREAYREALRHLWLRGIDAMEVFNPRREGSEQMAVYEIEDAAAVYDEMLAFRRTLDGGEALNLEVPSVDADILWSGVRRGGEAIVRAVALDGVQRDVAIEPWPGTVVRVRALPAGRSYRLRLADPGPGASVEPL